MSFEECTNGKVRATCPVCGKHKCTPRGKFNEETGESITRCDTCRKNKRKKAGNIYINKSTNYRYVYVEEDDPYFCMSLKHYIPLHRYRMAQQLKRPLKKGDIVIFKDKNRSNCDISNLTLSKRIVIHEHDLPSPKELADVLFLYSSDKYDEFFRIVVERVDKERKLNQS